MLLFKSILKVSHQACILHWCTFNHHPKKTLQKLTHVRGKVLVSWDAMLWWVLGKSMYTMGPIVWDNRHHVSIIYWIPVLAPPGCLWQFSKHSISCRSLTCLDSYTSLYCSLLHCSLYCTTLHFTAFYFTVHFTALYCTVLHCTSLYALYIALYCTLLH